MHINSLTVEKDIIINNPNNNLVTTSTGSALTIPNAMTINSNMIPSSAIYSGTIAMTNAFSITDKLKELEDKIKLLTDYLIYIGIDFNDFEDFSQSRNLANELSK